LLKLQLKPELTELIFDDQLSVQTSSQESF
jgi:hypothetical protein